MLTEEQKKEFAEDMGAELGKLVLENLVRGAIERYSREVSRMQKIRGEEEEKTAQAQATRVTEEQGTVRARAEGDQLRKQNGELRQKNENLEKELALREARVEKLRKEEERHTSGLQQILGARS